MLIVNEERDSQRKECSVCLVAEHYLRLCFVQISCREHRECYHRVTAANTIGFLHWTAHPTCPGWFSTTHISCDASP